MNDLERLAIAQAIYKSVAKTASTTEPYSLRRDVDHDIMSDYANDGIRSRDVMVNGKKVGTYSVTVKKVDEHDEVNVTDDEALREWANENPETLIAYVMQDPTAVANWVLANTGEVPNGCMVKHFDALEIAKGTRLSVKPSAVASALGESLQSYVAGLMEG